MENLSDIIEAAKGIGKSQKAIVESLFEVKSSLTIRFFGSDKAAIFKLQGKGIVQIEEDRVSLTNLGHDVYFLCQGKYDEEVNLLNDAKKKERKESSRSAVLKQASLEKSNQFLELYKQGLNRQEIGDRHEISRERVRQILDSNPAFYSYLKDCEEAEVLAEIEKREDAQKKIYSKSLAILYPERVSELWDYEKNGDLKPEEVLAGSTQHQIWFKCPIDEHSWKKKPNDIRLGWTRSGASGCPMCAGKKKKAEKQPCLIDIYPELVSQYWDYEKNIEIYLCPEKVTLLSSKKAWFKCPHDGNEWQSNIFSTTSQQWSKGNTGCRVCNGTDERKRGEWKRREPIAIEFPDQVAKYWLYEANNELGLDPTKLTIGSSKEAFFKCPIDGHEWVATITVITKHSWKKGNSGCPACRGFTVTETTSLISIYPDSVAQYWDYGKVRIQVKN